MFGSMVVVLPSKFEGGELVVKHKGDTESFQQGELSKFNSQYAAFYADCRHELKKVTSGHRLCLVYNLVKVSGYGLPTAADNCGTLKRLKNAARCWEQEDSDEKIVYMLEHSYTPAGIRNGNGSSKYKGNDADLVRLLDLAMQKGADLDYDHGVVSFSESGTGEGDGYYNHYNRWGGSDDSDDYHWSETIDSTLRLRLTTWGTVSVDTEEMVPEEYFEDKDPKSETFEPTGNEGVEAERTCKSHVTS